MPDSSHIIIIVIASDTHFFRQSNFSIHTFRFIAHSTRKRFANINMTPLWEFLLFQLLSARLYINMDMDMDNNSWHAAAMIIRILICGI